MNLETVIGIEIHCELKTKTKMFSGAPVTFGEAANTGVNEIDLAFPGTLPSVNKEAVALAVRASLALNTTIDPLIRFDRKNYYYSDLPKGYQITQQYYPLGSNGYLDIKLGEDIKRVRINRLHMEEDTAKQTHEVIGTLIDFNRAGNPLIEIVSEPDMSSAEEAVAYVSYLRDLLEYLDVSDAKMAEGSFRCDINISLRPFGYKGLGAKVEIKNLNSLNNIQRAIEFEIKRQSKLIYQNINIDQETRRFDEDLRETVSMRKKEGNVDYKYFPDPNITPILIEENWIKHINESMPETPSERIERYLTLGLSDYDASILVGDKQLSNYFEEVLKDTSEIKLVANWLITEVLSVLNKNSQKISDLKMQPKHLAQMINMITNKEISSKQAKEVFVEVLEGNDPKKVVKDKGMIQLTDSEAIRNLVIEALEQQPQAIEDYRGGKDRAIGFIVGQVMKKSQGQANPAITSKLVKEELDKRL